MRLGKLRPALLHKRLSHRLAYYCSTPSFAVSCSVQAPAPVLC